MEAAWQQRSPQELIPVVETERIEGLFVTLHQKSRLKDKVELIRNATTEQRGLEMLIIAGCLNVLHIVCLGWTGLLLFNR